MPDDDITPFANSLPDVYPLRPDPAAPPPDLPPMTFTNGPPAPARTELQLFLAMLTRAGIGHGKRHDYGEPRGIGVQVEDQNDPYLETEWWFDAAGNLVRVYQCE